MECDSCHPGHHSCTTAVEKTKTGYTQTGQKFISTYEITVSSLKIAVLNKPIPKFRAGWCPVSSNLAGSACKEAIVWTMVSSSLHEEKEKKEDLKDHSLVRKSH